MTRLRAIRNFVKSVAVVGNEATLTCTISMPSDGVTSEGASVLDLARQGYQGGQNREPSFDGHNRHGKLRYSWAADLGPFKPGR